MIRAPRWAAASPGDVASPPAGTADYARYVTALVGRYGPSGSFWSEHPEVPLHPIRDWQIWNEPNITRYWSRQPFAKGYVALLHAAATAIRRADPDARVVLCGLANFSWRALREIYRAGGRRWFDVTAVHPFTGKVANSLKIVKLNRAVMRRYGDARKPMLLTEVTWSSAKGRKVTTLRLGDDRGRPGQAADRRTAALRPRAQGAAHPAGLLVHVADQRRRLAQQLRLVRAAQGRRRDAAGQAGAERVPQAGAAAGGPRALARQLAQAARRPPARSAPT